jgi:hypothetical protein
LTKLTGLTLARAYYKDATATRLVMIIPIVLAGDDIYLSNNQTTASVIATAYDPDGFIASQEWTKITGGFVVVIALQL